MAGSIARGEELIHLTATEFDPLAPIRYEITDIKFIKGTQIFSGLTNSTVRDAFAIDSSGKV